MLLLKLALKLHKNIKQFADFHVKSNENKNNSINKMRRD